jgi:HEAT repeat protein
LAAGALPLLVELLSSGSEEGRANAAMALDNLDFDNHWSAVVAAGAIPPLVELLHDGSDDGRVNAEEALANLMCDNSDNTAAAVAAGALP